MLPRLLLCAACFQLLGLGAAAQTSAEKVKCADNDRASPPTGRRTSPPEERRLVR
jgi:hypothetical protein